jgi:acyl-CoA thioesterase
VTGATRFDRATAIEQTGDSRYRADLDTGYWVVAGPNGGYLAALVVRAVEAAVADPARAVRTVTLHYPARPVEGPVDIEVRVERAGRSLSTVSVRMTQGGALVVLGLAACSPPWAGMAFEDATMPSVPAAADCGEIMADGGTLGIHERFDYRWAVGHAPFLADAPPVVPAPSYGGGWIRTAEPRPVDAAAIASFTDAWPPAVFARRDPDHVVLGVPTVELTVHFRRRLPLPDAAADDWYLCSFRSRTCAEGFVEEDGEIWSADGLLVAQSRQLAIAR